MEIWECDSENDEEQSDNVGCDIEDRIGCGTKLENFQLNESWWSPTRTYTLIQCLKMKLRLEEKQKMKPE